MTAFLVDPRAEGITIGDFPMRTLKRDNLAEVHFEDAFVPDEVCWASPAAASRCWAAPSTWGASRWRPAASARPSAASTWRSPTRWSARPSGRRSASSR